MAADIASFPSAEKIGGGGYSLRASIAGTDKALRDAVLKLWQESFGEELGEPQVAEMPEQDAEASSFPTFKAAVVSTDPGIIGAIVSDTCEELNLQGTKGTTCLEFSDAGLLHRMDECEGRGGTVSITCQRE